MFLVILNHMRHLILLLTISVLISAYGKNDRINRLIATQQYEEARSLLDNALRTDPKNPKLLRQQIRYFLATEQVPFAVAATLKLRETQVLQQALNDPAPVIRITAVRCFGELKGPDSLPALIKAANDKDKSIRQAVIQALTKLEDPHRIPVLLKLLQDPDWFVRGNAALALGKNGNAETVTALFDSLNDSDQYVRKSARLSLSRLATPDNQSAYLGALASTNTTARSLAAIILAANGQAEATPILIAELNNPENPELPDIITAVTKTKNPDALPALRQLAANHQLQAILSLGEYQDRASVELLRNIRQSSQSSPETKTACTVALSKIGGK